MVTATLNKCLLCGHQGEDVNKHGSEHITDKVSMDFRLCDNAKACAGRVLLKQSTKSIEEYGCIPDDLDAQKIAEGIIDNTLIWVRDYF